MSDKPFKDTSVPDKRQEQEGSTPAAGENQDAHEKQGRRRDAMARLQKGLKFTSDEDIVRRRPA